MYLHVRENYFSILPNTTTTTSYKACNTAVEYPIWYNTI